MASVSNIDGRDSDKTNGNINNKYRENDEKLIVEAVDEFNFAIKLVPNNHWYRKNKIEYLGKAQKAMKSNLRLKITTQGCIINQKDAEILNAFNEVNNILDFEIVSEYRFLMENKDSDDEETYAIDSFVKYLVSIGRSYQAIDEIDKILENYPGNSYFHYIKGKEIARVAFNRGEINLYYDALKECDLAIQNDNSVAIFHYLKGRILKNMKMQTDGDREIEISKSLDSEDMMLFVEKLDLDRIFMGSRSNILDCF